MSKEYETLGDVVFDLVKDKPKNSKLISDILYMPIDDDRRILLSLTSKKKDEDYDTLKMEIYSKTHGKIHENEYNFKNLKHTIMLQRSRITFSIHIQKDKKSQKFRWCGYDPTETQITEINQRISNFVQLWQ